MAFRAKLISRERLAADVCVFRLEKPEGFRFLAGQYSVLSVPDAGFRDDRGLRRALSIASSPLEKELIFVTKLSNSAMKQTLAEMKPGTEVALEQAAGPLVLPERTDTPLAFLAGGIGIAPFRAMCRYATDAPTEHDITLFYSSRTPEETPFLEELQRMPSQNRKLSVAVTMTRAADEKVWAGLTGRLSGEMIRDHCPSWEKAAYYVAGPPAMADAMKQTLEAMAVPASRIKVELFAGY